MKMQIQTKNKDHQMTEETKTVVAKTTPTSVINTRRARKQQGVIGNTWDRLGSVTDNSLGVVDGAAKALNKGVQSFVPMAETLLNDSKTDLIESIVTLGLTQKSAEKQLLDAGFTPAEVAAMLAPARH